MGHLTLIGANNTFPMKLIDTLILSLVYVFSAAVVGADLQVIAISVGGSFAGAVILAYFQRDSTPFEQAFKVVSSSISGLVCGAALQEYFAIESVRFQLILFFMSGLLSLVMLRTLLGITERNAAEIIKGVLQRLLNLQLPDEREKRRRRSVRKIPAGRQITFDEKEGENEL